MPARLWGGEDTLMTQEEVYYFMQIQHELPLITTPLPQRPAFTAVNHGRSDNKQQKETGAVNGPSTPALFHDFIVFKYFLKLCRDPLQVGP